MHFLKKSGSYPDENLSYGRLNHGYFNFNNYQVALGIGAGRLDLRAFLGAVGLAFRASG